MSPTPNNLAPMPGRWLVMALVALVWPLMSAGYAVSAELLGYAHERRTVISWTVSEDVFDGILPEGWHAEQQGSGPHQGANFFLVLADQTHFEDVSPIRSRISDVQATIWTLPAASEDESGFMVLGGMITPKAAPGDYEVYLPASVLVNRTTEPRGGETLMHEEWEVRSNGEDDIRVRLTYNATDPQKMYDRTHTFSGLDPDIQRLYEYDEDGVVLYSRPAGVERLQSLEVDADGSPLDVFLDGSAQLVGVVTMPQLDIVTSLP